MTDTTTSGAHIDLDQRRMLPQPGWQPAAEPYWLAAGRNELAVQQCQSCKAHRWPISEACYNCQSIETAWSALPGTGRVFSFTWADFPPPPDGADRNIAVIELDGTQGPDPVRVMSWVVDIARDDLVCDLPVEVRFLPLDDEVAVPAWAPQA